MSDASAQVPVPNHNPEQAPRFAVFGELSDAAAEALGRAGVTWIDSEAGKNIRACTVADVRAAAKRLGSGEVEVSPTLAWELRRQILTVESRQEQSTAVVSADVFGGDGSFGWPKP